MKLVTADTSLVTADLNFATADTKTVTAVLKWVTADMNLVTAVSLFGDSNSTPANPTMMRLDKGNPKIYGQTMKTESDRECALMSPKKIGQHRLSHNYS